MTDNEQLAPQPGDPPACRAAVFCGPGQPLQLQRFPLPELGPEEALVRVVCCTLCGSDLHTAEGRRATPLPTVLGHETIGEVAAVGDPPPRDLAGRALRGGDRVLWSVTSSCHQCGRCRSGMPQKCRRLFKYGHEAVSPRGALSGGLAEYCHLRPGTAIVRVPPEVPDLAACPASCATATVAAALRAAGEIRGRRALIVGAGMLGVTACAMAAERGAEVVAADVLPRRLEAARQFGAEHAVLAERLTRPLPEAPEGFDVVVELSGQSSAMAASVEQLAVGGRLLLVGAVFPTESLSLDPERIVRGLWSIQGVHNYLPEDLQSAIDFLARSQSLPFADLVEQEFPLTRAQDALEFAIRRRPWRVAVRP